MNRRIAKGAAIGLAAGSLAGGGMVEVVNALTYSSVEKVNRCASKIGTPALLDALYAHETCNWASKDFTFRYSPSPVSADLGKSSLSVVVSGPSKDAFVAKELPGAESADAHLGDVQGIGIFVLAAVGAAAGGLFAKSRES